MTNNFTFDPFLRNIIGKIVFGWIILVLFHYLSSNLLATNLVAPVLKSTGTDFTYWIVNLLGIPEVLTQDRIISIMFDTSLFVLAGLAFCYPQKNAFAILFLLYHFCYFVTYNSYQCFHQHALVGTMLIVLPFCWKSNKSFTQVFYGIRYCLLSVYASASIWKMSRGTPFSADQMLNIIELNNVEYLYQNTSAFRTNLVTLLLDYPEITRWLFIVGAFMQLSFAIGFFTKKYDVYLIAMALLFHLSASLFVVINFFEIWILYITLLPWAKIGPHLTAFNMRLRQWLVKNIKLRTRYAHWPLMK